MADLGRIFSCARCATVLMQIGTYRFDWETGALHTCGDDMDAWLQGVTDDALWGDEGALQALPDVIEAWLRKAS